MGEMIKNIENWYQWMLKENKRSLVVNMDSYSDDMDDTFEIYFDLKLNNTIHCLSGGNHKEEFI